jgi:hypothetical protein
MDTTSELDTAAAHIAQLTLKSEEVEEEHTDNSEIDTKSESSSSEDDEKSDPEAVNKYEHSILYKIRYKTDEIKDCYVGSTTGAFEVRKRCHKSDVYNSRSKRHNYRVYTFIRANGGWDDWIMELIEEYPCRNKKELLARESYWIRSLCATLNVTMPGRTKKENYEENKEIISAKRKEYYAANRDRLNAAAKEHRENNKEYIIAREKAYIEANRERITARKKAYYDANRDRNIAYSKAYSEANKEILAEKRQIFLETNKERLSAERKTRIICECGAAISACSKYRHKKAPRHVAYIASIALPTTAE